MVSFKLVFGTAFDSPYDNISLMQVVHLNCGPPLSQNPSWHHKGFSREACTGPFDRWGRVSNLQTLWSGGQAHGRVCGTELAVPVLLTGRKTQTRSIVVSCPAVTGVAETTQKVNEKKQKNISSFLYHPFVNPQPPRWGLDCTLIVHHVVHLFVGNTVLCLVK